MLQDLSDQIRSMYDKEFAGMLTQGDPSMR